MDPITVIPFKRGATFSFMFAIPDELPNGYFKNWVPVAQLRKAMNSQPTGLIANLACFWADPATTRYLIVNHTLTSKWPIGRVEMDIMFQSASGERIPSTTVLFNFLRGITE